MQPDRFAGPVLDPLLLISYSSRLSHIDVSDSECESQENEERIMMQKVAIVQSASRYLNIVLGFLILLFGLIVNTLHILHDLASRILSVGLDIDPTRTSFFYCKLQPLLVAITYLILYKIKTMSETNKTRCDAFNTAMNQYTNWFVFNISTFIIQTGILAIFGCLTLPNVRRVGYDSEESHIRQQIERQMSSVSS
jgi:hypothetical protein